MNIIGVAEAELRSGELTPASLDIAARALAADGYVILRGVVPLAPLEKLRERMDRDTAALLAFQAEHGGNPRARGHLQQAPPPEPNYLFPEVFANPLAWQISAAVLGPKPYLAFWGGNTNCPDSGFQRPHLDNPHLWPHSPMASPAYSLVINVPPMACTKANGAVEIWPGTHMLAGRYPGNHVPPEDLHERDVMRPSVRVETEPGDLVLRDTRVWHRGVPNSSDQPRHMIAFILAAAWLRRRRPVLFRQDCRERLARLEFDFNAEFVEETDYLLGPTKTIYRREGEWRDDRTAPA